MFGNRRWFLRIFGVGGLAAVVGIAGGQSDGEPVVDTAGATDVEGSSATLTGTLDDLGGADSAEVALKYRRRGSTDVGDYEAVGRQTLASTRSFQGTATELQAETEYEFHAVANASDGDSVNCPNQTFSTGERTALAVATAGTTDVDGDSAILRGRLDALGEADSVEVALKYRRSDSRDLGDYRAVGRQTLSTTGSFDGSATGLDPDTEYEFHAVANAGDGDSTNTANETFRTTVSHTPSIETAGTTNVDDTSATLHGTLADLGGADSAEVALKYRRRGSTDVGDYEAVGRQTLTSTGSFQGTATEVAAETEYEFHAVANASDGDSANCPNETFSTAAASSGSAFGYADGFADVSWFDDDVDVYRIQSPTRSELETAVQASGPRLVVFETSGTIDLEEEDLRVPNDECWIAGQTAPSPGITLVRGGFYVDASDCVVQHVRLRAGDAGNEDGWEPDSGHTGDDTTNNVFDHVTASWGVDETLSVGYRTTDTTVVNCLIYEGLANASHSKGTHSMGSLTGDNATGVTYAGNVWAHNHRRNPRLKAGTRPVVLNNLVYHFVNGTAMDASVRADIEGNGYLRTEATYNIKGARQDGDTPVVYLADNYTEADNTLTNGQFERLDSRPFWPGGLTAIPAGDVESHNLAYAGARPADRTSHDERVIDDVVNRDGGFIDSQSEVGGYPALAEHTHALDVPETGVRSWLDQWARAVEEDDVTPP